MLPVILTLAVAAASPRALVKTFAAAYIRQVGEAGLLEGKDRRAMAPFFTARLLKILDDASACQKDWMRQQPKDSTDKPPFVDCCLMFGEPEGVATSFKIGAVETMPDGRAKVAVDLERKDGRDTIRWRNWVIVTMENGRYAVDDYTYDEGGLLSKSFTECRGGRWIGGVPSRAASPPRDARR